MVFFHALSGGFYLEDLHGPRTILVPDPDWIRPMVSIPDPGWLPPDENPDADPPLVDVPDLDAVHPLIEVEDTQAMAPLVEVDNPSCTLPPADELIEVAEDDYYALLDAQSRGLLIRASATGHPEAVEPPPLPTDELERRERLWRDNALSATDGMVVRHRDELEAERETTLTGTQYAELQAYRLALRAWPESPDFPAAAKRPTPPDWLASTTT